MIASLAASYIRISDEARGAFCRRSVRRKPRRDLRHPWRVMYVADVQRLLPSLEGAAWIGAVPRKCLTGQDVASRMSGVAMRATPPQSPR